jgi:hypothetical protein
MSAVISELAAASFIDAYIADLNRLLAAALAAERDAQFEIGEISELEPATPLVTSAYRSAFYLAVDRLNTARAWQEAIAAQLAAVGAGRR